MTILSITWLKNSHVSNLELHTLFSVLTTWTIDKCIIAIIVSCMDEWAGRETFSIIHQTDECPNNMPWRLIDGNESIFYWTFQGGL